MRETLPKFKLRTLCIGVNRFGRQRFACLRQAENRQRQSLAAIFGRIPAQVAGSGAINALNLCPPGLADSLIPAERVLMIDYVSHSHSLHSDVLVVEASGKLDSVTSKYLLDCMQGIVQSGTEKIVLDCENLHQINSMGLASLVRANSRLKKIGGVMAIASATGPVADVLKLVHFDRLFGIYSTVDEAAAAIAS